MAEPVVRPNRRRRKILLLLGCLVLIYFQFGHILQTGAIFYLLPPLAWRTDHRMPGDDPPRHKGSIHLATGLYGRINEDLAVAGTPLVLRRTYRTLDRDKRHFGIGATHDAEWWLYPEDPQLQRASLILSDSSRVTFDRISAGTSYANALFEHHESATWFAGARLGWTGFNWAMRAHDGSVAVFQACGPSIAVACSIVRLRDADGHVADFKRDRQGRLTRMVFGDRWIAFDYDDQDRVSHAAASTGKQVRYQYDAGGRLTAAVTSDQQAYRYTYTDKDELATIDEPDATIENFYDDNGRCIRQVNRFPDTPVPLVFEFSYRLDGTSIVETEMRQSDGAWQRVAFAKNQSAVAETIGMAGEGEIAFAYERDPTTGAVQSLAMTCQGRSGEPMTHTSLVRDGDVDRVKADLVRTHCRRDWRRRTEPSNRRLDDSVIDGVQ